MKTFLLVSACLILAGCGREAARDREILNELKTLRSELASRQGSAARWALANKREIESAIFRWTFDKMQEVKKSEALSPEVEEKVRQYEALQAELTRKQMEKNGFRLPTRTIRNSANVPTATDMDLETLSQKVTEAKAPVAEIIERRSRQMAQFREQYPIDRLVSDYAKDRYDLVVDSNEKVLYRSAVDVPDITEGVIAYFKEKTK